MASAPTLTTGRLTLRGHRASDRAACAALWGDPAVTRFILPRPSTPEEAWSRTLRYAGHWALLDFGYWLVEETATGRLVGECGFADFHRSVPLLEGRPEIGWIVAADAQGKGFATEAVGAAIAWSERHFGDRPTACIIDPDNAPSLRIAERYGYREVARVDYHGPVIVFHRPPATVAP